VNKNIVKTALILLILLTAGFTYSCSRLKRIDDFSHANTESAAVKETAGKSIADGSGNVSGASSSEAKIQETVSEKKKIVYVCGCVKSPDVYELKPGARIIDAVSAAGGFADGAASDYLNLAEPVADGMKIYVPTVQEITEGTVPYKTGDLQKTMFSADGSADPSGREKVNINTASKEELMTLSGIGEVRAQGIIDYRNGNGKFLKPEDLMKVSGIKEGSFSKIRDRIIAN
jgi:competence protein ComEA